MACHRLLSRHSQSKPEYGDVVRDRPSALIFALFYTADDSTQLEKVDQEFLVSVRKPRLEFQDALPPFLAVAVKHLWQVGM